MNKMALLSVVLIGSAAQGSFADRFNHFLGRDKVTYVFNVPADAKTECQFNESNQLILHAYWQTKSGIQVINHDFSHVQSLSFSVDRTNVVMQKHGETVTVVLRKLPENS